MKRNKSNPGRERKRRRRANGHVAWKESLQTMGGKGNLGLKTQRRAEIVSPVEQERRRRHDARSKAPAELRKIAGDMAQAREQGGSDGQ
ncbi:hypothetical protein LCGC14_2103540 [marine sediment metagenome]|uniref:Uncharacterized protein n=1 Tax=marine sediment metagenome TaxID=412755 RepID=A0A0F9EWC9_9ZZZZ